MAKATWEQGKYGGWSLKLAGMFVASVDWGTDGRGYVARLEHATLNGRFTDAEEAKKMVEKLAVQRFRQGLQDLGEK